MSFIVQFVLHKYLDKFFYGIDKKNIEAGILDGRISISNIGLQQNLLDNLNFPIKINYSYVEKVQLHIPWRSQETPVNIYISNIYALISAKDKSMNVYDIFMKKKQKAITEGIEAFLQSLKQQPQQKQAGMISSKIKKLLYNVNINIGCIHFRYEQNTGSQGFSFGLKINNINVFNVNKEGRKQFFNYDKSEQKIIRVQLSIDFIGLYVNSKETKFIYRRNAGNNQSHQQKRSDHGKNQKQSMNKKQKKQASKRDYAYLTNQMRQISFPEKLSSSSSIQHELHYVFVISVKTLVSYNILASQMSKTIHNQNMDLINNCVNVAIISFDIEFPSVCFKITQDQYHNIKKTIDFFSSFQSYWREYVSSRNLVIVKEKNYVDISILLKQKKKKTELTPKQKFQLKSQCRKYMKWIFLTVYEERLKRSFLVEALKKDITLQNLLKNQKICKIVKKINQEKLKSWVMQAMLYRKMFLESATIFQRFSETKIKNFLNKQLGTFESIFSKKEQLSTTTLNIKEDFLIQKPYEYDVSIRINLFTLQVSKMDKFGVEFVMKNLRSQFLKRKENYSIEVKIQDLQANVFSNKNGQKYKTIVPIIRKSIIQPKQQDLLYFKYEKNPFGSLYINAEIELDFESIQITIYPEAFQQFHSILFNNPQKAEQTQNLKKKPTQKKISTQKEPEENWKNDFQTANLLQRNKVRGKIRSPWIIFPLGRNNNPEKQCWVVRLGDFNLQTPQEQRDDFFIEKESLYEKYSLELKQFELKFFSSVNFFYSWLKFNQNEEVLYSIPYYKNLKIINMIKPFTCAVDFSRLKSGLSSTTKTKNYSYISNIHIEGIQIFLSNFLLEKLKQRIDVLGQQQNYEDFQFIEQNVQNIYEEHVISGWAKVTNQKWKEMKFFVVLKGHFIYYFVSESEKKYYFFTDVRKTMIRLVGRSIEKINPEIKDEKISIFLTDVSMLNQWKKHIVFSLQKKEKKSQEESKPKEEQKKNQQRKAESFEQKTEILTKQQQKRRSLKVNKTMKDQVSNSNLGKQQEHTSSQRTKIELTFIMNRLQIKLKDKQSKQFLLCYFKKSNFTYRCLYSPEAAFSLSSWNIFESQQHKQKGIPFLSSKRFYNSDQITHTSPNRDFNEMTKQKQDTINILKQQNQNDLKERGNFLQVKVEFNSITNQLSDISVDIDKFFIAWKVDLITKILGFFFYSSQMGDTPTPSSIEKRTLCIKFKMNKFYCYAYQSKQLAGLIKLHCAEIQYYQSNIQEYFDVRFKKMEIDNSINNSLDNKENMFISKGNQNPFKLKYHIRKKNYKKRKQFQNVQTLKEQFGAHTIVSILTCELQDSIVIYEHQLTFRMLNYVLNHVLGTVAAKFKKRQYSPKYIYQFLKLQKISVMEIKIKNFTFVIPPHNKYQNHLMAEIEEFIITKNFQLLNSQYKPKKIKVPTKFEPINLFYETMHFQFMNVKIFQRFGKENPVPINQKTTNFRLLMSKVNFSTDFFNVLNHYDDFDRLSTMKIQFLDDLQLQISKITFVTILQIFYQNIKQRDGRAQIFEPVHPYPPKKQYVIEFPMLKANLYEYNQKSKSMQIFNKAKMQKFIIVYNTFGTKSQMVFSSIKINSEGEIPIDVWTAKKQRLFHFKMMSDTTHSVTKIELNVKGYQLDFCFDKLNNLLEFINYDSDYVSNKKMPHKPSSFMCVNVFAQQCLLKLEELWASGEFLVTYTKNAKNNFQKEVLRYLQVDLEDSQSNKEGNNEKYQSNSGLPAQKHPYQEIADKEIKVDGQNIKLTIKGDTIGQLSNLYFHRLDLSSKKSMKRYKREIVQIGEGIVSLQISDFERIIKAYDKRIKKSPQFVLKNFFEPWNNLPHKLSYTQKRMTEVQFAKINAFLIPNQKKNSLFYFMGQVKIPKLMYCTFGKEQEISVDLGAIFSQHTNTIHPEMIGEIKKLKIIYKNDKDKAKKEIQITNANHINFYLANLNSETLYLLTQQIKSLSSANPSSSKFRKYLNFNYAKSAHIHSFVTIFNTTSYQVTLQIASLSSITVQSFKQHQTKLNFQQLLEIFIDPQSLFILDVGNKRNSYKQKLWEVQLYKEIQVGEDMIMKISFQSDAFVVHLFEGCILKNKTKLNFYVYSAEDKQFKLRPGEQKCFILVDTSVRRPTSNHLNIHRKIQKVFISLYNPQNSFSKDRIKEQGEEISLKNSGEDLIFNNLVLVHKGKKHGMLTIELRQRFVLCNFTPFEIDTGYEPVLHYKDESPLSYGLYSGYRSSQCSAINYEIFINKCRVDLCLKKCPTSIEIELNDKNEEKGQQKMYVDSPSRETRIRIHIKELKSQIQSVSYIFLYTKIIYHSLSVQGMTLHSHSSQNCPKDDNCQVSQIENGQQTSLRQDQEFIYVQNSLTSKSQIFNIGKFIKQENSSGNSKETSPLFLYGNTYYLMKQQVNILRQMNLDPKQFSNSLKYQFTQVKVNVTDCCSITNITPFIIKVKGAFDIFSEQSDKNQMKYNTLTNQDEQIQYYTQIHHVEVDSDSQKSIPFQYLTSKNQKELPSFLEACFMDLKSRTKFYRRLKILDSSIYYIQLGDEICKVTILTDQNVEKKQNKQKNKLQQQRKKSKWLRIIFELSEEGYKIENNIQDIVVEVKNGEFRNNKYSSMPMKKSIKLSKDISYISDGSDIEDQLRNEHQSNKNLVQPSTSQNFGIKSFSSQGHKILSFTFYYPLRNIDFKQSVVMELDNISALTKKEIYLTDPSKKSSFTILIITEMLKDSRFHIKLYKKSVYEESIPQTLRLMLKQVRLSIYLGQLRSSAHFEEEKIKLQLCNLNIWREKHIDMQSFDIKLQKILLIEGSTQPIIAALDKTKHFLNLHAILQKAPQGLKGKSISVKLTPVQVNGREQILLKLLQKMARIRSYKIKGVKNHSSISKQSGIRQSMQRQRIINYEVQIDQPNILKQWQLLKKSPKPISLELLQVASSSIFLSYTKSQQILTNSPFLSDPILKYFLLLPSIGETKLPIPDFQIKNFNGATKQLLKLIAKELKSTIGQSILYSLTSLSIFDNPIQAVDDLIRYVMTILQTG